MRESTGNLTPPSKMAIKGKKHYVRTRASLKSNVTLMTISNIHIPMNIIDYPKIS